MGHVTMENRHGLAVAGVVTKADGTAERRASQAMLKAKRKAVGHRITAGADTAEKTKGHGEARRASNVTPHVAQNNGPAKIGKRRRSSIDARTTRHASYGMSQKRRKMIECIFGWGKQHGTMRKAKHRGVARIMIRIPKLVAALGELRKETRKSLLCRAKRLNHQHKAPYRNGKSSNFPVFPQTARPWSLQVKENKTSP